MDSNVSTKSSSTWSPQLDMEGTVVFFFVAIKGRLVAEGQVSGTAEDDEEGRDGESETSAL